MTPHPPPDRATGLDNLRVSAMLLGLVLHGILPFKATAICRFPIRDLHAHLLADLTYFAIHAFRMPLFFLLAGYAGAALAARRGTGGLVRDRVRRIGLPLLAAVVVVTPVMHVLFVSHDAARRGRDGWADGLDFAGWAGPNFHLWFLYYLMLCYLPLAGWPAARRLPARLVQAADAAFRRLAGAWWKAPVLAAAAVPLAWGEPDWWVETPQGWWPDSSTYAYYLGFFGFGAMLHRHRDLLTRFGRQWPAQLVVAHGVVLPVMLKLTMSGNWAEDAAEMDPPAWLPACKAAAILASGTYTWLTMEGLIGLFHRHLTGGAGWWRYLAGASYWCYLAGFPAQVALQVALAHHRMPILAKFALVNAVTFAVLLVSYEWGVRRTWVGVLLSGKRAGQAGAKPTSEVIAARVRVAPEPPIRNLPVMVGDQRKAPARR